MEPAADDSLQRRFESGPIGRVAISLFAGATLIAVLVTLLPGGSAISQRATGTTQPYLNAIGLDQNWGVFAPDPRNRAIELQGRVTYANGQTAVWHLPDGNQVTGAWWDYRWRKFVEYATSQDYQQYWKPVAAYVARHERRDGQLPVQVTLVSRFKPITPPGKKQQPVRWQENAFYNYDVGASRR